MYAESECVANHIRLHSDEPGAAGARWVFLVGPVGRLDLSLFLGYLPPADLIG